MNNEYAIASFYRFVYLDSLETIKKQLLKAMETRNVTGTIIIATEGYNGTISARKDELQGFLEVLGQVLGGQPEFKLSFHDQPGFKRRKVKIKNEIVTLKKPVNMDLGKGTHIKPEEWNEIISDPDVTLLDARNTYEFELGTFRNAINPATESFSELPAFIGSNFDPAENPKIAMFCTGGIRCEKLAPYLVAKGFKQVMQLDGGILRYLEETPKGESLWDGECFVFDERVSIDKDLRKGSAEDISASKKMSQKKQA